MNNDHNHSKQMISQESAARLRPSKAVRKLSRPSAKIASEIRNLPENCTLTQEILRNNICRICATYYESGPRLIPLYTSCEGSRTLAIMVNDFLPIKVVKEDGLPRFVCRSCTGKLLAWRATWDACAESQKILSSQAELLDMTQTYNRTDKSLTEAIESVLATYSLNISSMTLVCQKCDSKTSSEEFSQHLIEKHGDVRDKDVEAFVRDNVIFEETLESDHDGDRTSLASTGTSEASPCLECPLCNTEFSTRSLLFQHLTKYDVNTDSIPCCGVSRNKTELVRHLRTDYTDTLRCKSCDHVAVNTAAFATHHSIAHCNTESTSDVPKRAPQSRDETNQKRIPAVCPDCNRAFSNKYNMLNHLKKHGKTSEQFQCECGKTYTTRGNLVAHKRIAHLKELPHSCTECGERFPSRSARDIHSRLHSGSRPFSCTLCSRAFRAKNSLDKHVETHGPRRHDCELCGKRFRRTAHLKYHVGTHRRPT